MTGKGNILRGEIETLASRRNEKKNAYDFLCVSWMSDVELERVLKGPASTCRKISATIHNYDRE